MNYQLNEQFGTELKQLLMNIQAHEELGELNLRDRAIVSAVQFASYMGLKSGFRPREDETVPAPDWAGKIVAYIELPTGQVAFYMQKHTVEYDGHDRATKIKRIADYVYDRVVVKDAVNSATTNQGSGTGVLN